MSKDYEIFKGKKLSDLFQEIHQNSEVKRVQIDSMLSHLTSMISNPDDAVQLVLSENIRTSDIFEGVGKPVGTSEMGDAIVTKLDIIAEN